VVNSEFQWNLVTFGALYLLIHIGVVQKLEIIGLEVWLSVNRGTEFLLTVKTDELEIEFE
jgi:hypothetical protein